MKWEKNILPSICSVAVRVAVYVVSLQLGKNWAPSPRGSLWYSCVCEMWCRMGCIGSTVHPIGRYIHQPLPSPRPSMTRMLGMLFTNRRRWFQQQTHHLAFRQAHGPRSTVTRLVWPTHHLWSAATYQNLTPCLMTSTHRQRCTPLLPWNDERQVWYGCLWVRNVYKVSVFTRTDSRCLFCIKFKLCYVVSVYSNVC